jgi:inosine/xanthosine triphosphatase
MKVGVGSKNRTKVDAVAECLRDYPLFLGADVEGVAVQVEEFGHPKSIEETVAGAIDRARQAQEGRDYGFGIEGGLIAVPYSKTGYMEVAACAIYDGTNAHIGLGPACEWPKDVIDGILNKGLDGSQAMKAAGITKDDKVGENKGFIHIVTKGRMDRTAFNKAAITMALVHLENPEYY